MGKDPKNVFIGSLVDELGDEVFSRLNLLEEVDFTYSYIILFPRATFENCSKLKTILDRDPVKFFTIVLDQNQTGALLKKRIICQDGKTWKIPSEIFTGVQCFNTKANGTGTWYDLDTNYSAPSSNLTLYANYDSPDLTTLYSTDYTSKRLNVVGTLYKTLISV